MKTGFWIETNWGSSINNATAIDILSSLEEIVITKKNNAVFWIGDNQGLNALQIDKNYCSLHLWRKFG